MITSRIQLRNDTAANWTTANPILAKGEPGHETDTYQWKIGDGVTPWNDLPYRGYPCVQQTGDSETEAMSQKAVTDELNALKKSVMEDTLIDYGCASSKYGGAPKIDYGNASTIPTII